MRAVLDVSLVNVCVVCDSATVRLCGVSVTKALRESVQLWRPGPTATVLLTSEAAEPRPVGGGWWRPVTVLGRDKQGERISASGRYNKIKIHKNCTSRCLILDAII